MVTFRLRPHHLICSLCFSGKGYNKEFIQNFKAIYKTLNSKPGYDATIKIIDCCDDICAKCPEKQGDLCNYESKIIKLDAAYLAILQLKINQIITFEVLKSKVKKLLTMENFNMTCQECSWYPLNICAPIIKNLIQNK